jgi:hypothetical protein
VDDALVAQNLDHLVKIAVDTDFPTTVHLNSVIGYLADNGTAASFDRTTDSLEAIGTASGGAGQAGAGASEQTITIEDDNTDPIADVKCWITSTNDPSANIVAGPFTTTSAGLVVLASDSSSKPMLDADTTYYLWREKDGINFENPQSFTAE